MDFVILGATFLLGTIIGSFLNVVIFRYNSGSSPLTGRSQCFSCGKKLSWHELVPVFSFLIQRGRCTKCKTRISWQSPIVELLSGLIFVAVLLLSKPIVESVYLVIVFSTLLVIAVYDMRHKIIPDGLAFLFAIVSLVWFFWSLPGIYTEAFRFPYYWTLIAGPLLFFPFWLLWFVSGGRWVGLGDGKLALGIGWFLGATLGGSAIMLGFWIGAAYALTIMAYQKASQKLEVLKSKSWAPAFLSNAELSMQSEIPFGPFLILGTIIVYFTGVNFFDGTVNFFNFL